MSGFLLLAYMVGITGSVKPLKTGINQQILDALLNLEFSEIVGSYQIPD